MPCVVRGLGPMVSHHECPEKPARDPTGGGRSISLYTGISRGMVVALLDVGILHGTAYCVFTCFYGNASEAAVGRPQWHHFVCRFVSLQGITYRLPPNSHRQLDVVDPGTSTQLLLHTDEISSVDQQLCRAAMEHLFVIHDVFVRNQRTSFLIKISCL
jgi:hypothetical protein